ncbi:hypothetical protein MPH48_03545 [Lysinibacillus fusiformis]|uniref:hypothetical protein n=1 Tax=Lysinibacillus fusiformis TaxID=28031 RepID=UPI001F4E2B9C|nr:hypothetical protein [Lysinibacillus fusiformis]MCK1987173.1 hypothetical protein [Lysinibacillus fusiformis]
MEILKLDLDIYWDLMLPIIILILFGGIYGAISKSQLINFEKYFAMFKCIFYLLLAVLTLFLDVAVVNDKITSIDLSLPDKLTIGQFLLIALSVLESCSNLVDVLKAPKSESHLLTREAYWKYRNDNFPIQMKTQMETYNRIHELEKEIEIIKRNTVTTNSFRKKRKRGKKRKK